MCNEDARSKEYRGDGEVGKAVARVLPRTALLPAVEASRRDRQPRSQRSNGVIGE
jgi:hypothetical protein